MILRLGAAICAGAIVANPSSPVARPADQNQNKLSATAMGPAIRGIASTYNPFRPGYRSGGKETASGEPYDPAAWSAGIQVNLRDRFGGVRYGRNYRSTYALVTSADKQAIVKIDDVGPLARTRSRYRRLRRQHRSACEHHDAGVVVRSRHYAEHDGLGARHRAVAAEEMVGPRPTAEADPP
jgi:rare lipoprotein A